LSNDAEVKVMVGAPGAPCGCALLVAGLGDPALPPAEGVAVNVDIDVVLASGKL
jgi:hypothetical protein